MISTIKRVAFAIACGLWGALFWFPLLILSLPAIAIELFGEKYYSLQGDFNRAVGRFTGALKAIEHFESELRVLRQYAKGAK